MKKFFKNITIFLIGLLVILIVLSKLVDPFIYGHYDENVKELNQRKPEIIILGDSHGWALKQESCGDRIFNFSYDSDSFYDMYCKLNYCIESGIPVKTVLLECDMHMFSEYRILANNAKRTVTFVDYSVYNQAYDTNILDYLVGRYVYPKISALDINNARLLLKIAKSRLSSLFSKKNPVNNSAPQTWSDLTPEKRRKAAYDRAAVQFSQPFTPHFEKAFNKIIDLCHRNGINIIGIRFPITPEYREEIRKVDLKKVEEVYENGGIQIIDLSSAFDDPKYFLNQDHLVGPGVELYCKMLLVELERLNLM